MNAVPPVAQLAGMFADITLREWDPQDELDLVRFGHIQAIK